MIGVSILTLLIYAFTQFLTGAMKGQKNVQNAVDFDILKTSINLVLNTSACDGAFKDASDQKVALNFSAPLTLGANILASPLPVAKIYQGNSAIVDMSSPNLGGGLKLNKLEFTNVLYDGDQTLLGVSYKAFLATLLVDVLKPAGSVGLKGFSKNFSVRLLVLPNASGGVVEKCATSANEKFDTSCNYFMGPSWNIWSCCRINVSDGITDCKHTGDGLTWTAAQPPWATASVGTFRLSCTYNSIPGAVNEWTCCRTNVTTGAVDCKGTTDGATWTTYASPW